MELRNDQRRRPRAAKKALSVNGGFGWTEDYWLSRSADHSEWVLWISWFDHDEGRIANSRAGACPRRGVDPKDAALELATSHWQSCRDVWDASAPRASAGELLTPQQVETLTERIWPRKARSA